MFGERFLGQTRSEQQVPNISPDQNGRLDDQPHDFLSGLPVGPLTVLPGDLGKNVGVLNDDKTIAGINSYGMPSGYNADQWRRSVGEGSLAVLFPIDQKEFGFLAEGFDRDNHYAPNSQLFINFFSP